MAKNTGKGHGMFQCACNYSTSNAGQWAKHTQKCKRNQTEGKRKAGISMNERRASSGGNKKKAAA